jgi:hypothetical protein
LEPHACIFISARAENIVVFTADLHHMTMISARTGQSTTIATGRTKDACAEVDDPLAGLGAEDLPRGHYAATSA